MDGGTYEARCADAEGGGRWPPALIVTCHANVDERPFLGTYASVEEPVPGIVVTQLEIIKPDGTVTSRVDVDSNGRIQLPPGTTDYSESVSELLANPASICPFWDDLTFDGAADDLYFNALPGVALITWESVRRFDTTELFTFVKMRNSSATRMSYPYDDTP